MVFDEKFFKAPGCEKEVVQITESAAQGNLSQEYDSKKLLADKALQHKPDGDPRTPNRVWSGLGFSSSMPESVIREKFHQEQTAVRHARNEKTPISGQGAPDLFGESTQGTGFNTLLSNVLLGRSL